jgi:Secretion system C-terminal sorting domain
MKTNTLSFFLFITLITSSLNAQTWQDVGGGTNNSSHGLLTWNDKLIDLGSFNSPCNRVAEWDGTSWSCLAGGVGLVARAGVVWDGKLVVVGDFWNVFQPCVGCNGVAVWDGTSWTPLDNGVNNDVLVCTVWNNQLVIAGDFTQADGVPCSRIIKWNGTEWESIGPTSPTTFSNDIRCMVEFEGDLYVGGDFNNVGGCSACDGLVKYDPSTDSWVGGNSGVDLVGGVDYSVRCLYVNPSDGNLYMGGEFPELWDGDATAPDPNMAYIAMYDGSNWTSLGTGLNEYVRAIHEYNGDLVAGGYFTNAGGVPANKIAQWDGTNWSAMGLGFDASGIDEYVKSATVWNGIFFAGGAYTQAEGAPMDHIAQWYEAPTDPPIAWMNSSTSSLCGSGCVYFLDNSTSGPTSWTWSFPGSSLPTSSLQNPGSVCYSSPGTYTATLTACNVNGCDTQTMEIEVSSGANLSVSDQSVCDGAPATLIAVPDVSGGTYLWSTGATTSSISVTPATTTAYTVSYTLPGCAAGTDTAIVTVGTTPTISLNVVTPVICEGQTATLTVTPSTGGGTYAWSPGSGTGATITPTPPMTTTYTVTYTLNGCTSLASTGTVTVNPLPIVSVADETICFGESVTLNALPSPAGGTFVWSPGGETTSSITVSPGTTSNYSIVYTEGGCASVTEIATVTVNPLPTVSVADETICEGNSVTLIANPSPGGGTFVWSPGGETTSSITVSPGSTSNYSIVYTQGGCASTPEVSTVTVLPDPVTSVTVVSGTATSDQGGALYQWLDCNSGMAAIGGATSQSYTPGTAGNFAVEVNLGSCVDTSSCVSLIPSAITEINEINQIHIYPNPANEIITIENRSLNTIHYTISDVTGKTILSGSLSNGSSSLNISAFAKGLYFFNPAKHGNAVIKIIKN